MALVYLITHEELLYYPSGGEGAETAKFSPRTSEQHPKTFLRGSTGNKYRVSHVVRSWFG